MRTRKLAVILAAAFAGTFLGWCNSALGAKYTATACLMVRSREPAMLSHAEREYSDKEFQTFKKTQRLLVRSNFVLMTALRKPDVAKLPSVQAEQREGDPARWLRGIIKVEFPDDAEVMSVSCTRSNPAEAQTLVKSVVDAYLTEVVNEERDYARQRATRLEEVVAGTEAKLRTARMELHQLTEPVPAGKGKTAAATPPTVDSELLRLEIKTLEQELIELRLELLRRMVELRRVPGSRSWSQPNCL